MGVTGLLGTLNGALMPPWALKGRQIDTV